MAVSFVSANAAYQAAARMGTSGAEGSQLGANFSEALAEAVRGASSAIRGGEAAAAQGAAGQGDIVQVVNAVNAAELTLETVVAIRDKVISAYQDIMRMPI